MGKPARPWIVAPHDPLQKLEDNLWTVEGIAPTIPGRFHRRMTIVKKTDGTLLFFNAIPVDDRTLAEIRAWGRPAELFITHAFHTVDAHAFRERLGLKVYGPSVALDQVRLVVAVDGTHAELPPDPAIRVETMAGTRTGEGCLLVESAGATRTSLLVGDFMLNERPGSGFFGWLWQKVGFTGSEPKVGPVWKLRAVHDAQALRGHIEKLASTPHLTRLVPTHGVIVEQEPEAVLRRIAATL